MKIFFFKSVIFAFALLFLFAISCEDYTKLQPKGVDSGRANFSSYVAVGNSLTAGYQSGALYESAQKFSYPKLLSRQLDKSKQFSQPLISDPGIGGRIELTSLNPLGTTIDQQQGQPINQDEKPYNNMGIPGAVLVDYANPGNSGYLKERAMDPSNPSYNPFYGIMMEQSELQKSAPNIHDEVAKQNPTFITFWLGNNDVLGYVTSGGEGQSITPSATFTQLYQASAQLLKSTSADVTLYNIPDVTSIPFVFLVRAQLEQEGIITFNNETQSYQLVTEQGNFDIYIDVDGTSEVMRNDDFLLLTAQSYFTQIQNGSVPPPIQPQNAIPDNLVLDGNLATLPVDSELEQAAGAVAQYNATIKQVAQSFGFALVDVNQIFNQIVRDYQASDGTGGYNANGLVLQPVPGSLFTFDGIHVTNRGAAVIANETINVINGYYGANVEKIDVHSIARGLPVVSEN